MRLIFGIDREILQIGIFLQARSAAPSAYLQVTSRWPLDPPFCAHIQVRRPDQLKLRVVVHYAFSGQREVVPPHKLGQEDADFL